MIQVEVQTEDFCVDSEYQQMRQQCDGAGAIVFFVGLVRELYASHESSEAVSHIELQHYPGMSEQQCLDICDQAQHKFSLLAVRVVHRVGRLAAGDQIVFVAASAHHRQAAFDGAQFIMDYLKTKAPFWKKEVGSRGEKWVGMKDNDIIAAKRWQ